MGRMKDAMTLTGELAPLRRRHTESGGLKRWELALGAALMAVVLLILVPVLLRQRVQRNHARVHADLVTIFEAQNTFFSNGNLVRYASLDELFSQNLGLADLRPAERKAFRDGVRHGYILQVRPVRRPGDRPGYDLSAVPVHFPYTGVLSFFMDESGVVRAANVKGKRSGPDAPVARTSPTAQED